MIDIVTPVLGPNPLREGGRLERTPAPASMVIFGATGDLTHRKLIPALYNLAVDRLLPPGFTVVAFARRDYTDESFRAEMLAATREFSRRKPIQEAVWENFAEGIFYHRSEFTDDEGYVQLATRLATLDAQRGTGGNRVYYLATAPEYYPEIIRRLGSAGLGQGGLSGNSTDAAPESASETARGWARIIVEKPFGHDLQSARQLNRQVLQVFEEDQVFRIDHYLGKETVQNIIALRFANGIFEPIWNRRYVDHVQIAVAETVGVEDRGGYYDTSGAIRDMVQSHMMQVMALIAMEPPASFDADAVRDEKVKVMRAIHPIEPHTVATETVRAQYAAGWSGGASVPGYLQEQRVPATSITDTYVALKFMIDNWRWADVPFYLRTGKRLPKRVSEVAIQFKRAPLLLFGKTGTPLDPDVLTIRIQPDEGITLKFGVKVPGPSMSLRAVNMDFFYSDAFVSEPADAYERLILDCLLGDSTLFTRRDEVEVAWTLITRILEGWQAQEATHLPAYEAGTWGPPEADAFIERDGRRWRRP